MKHVKLIVIALIVFAGNALAGTQQEIEHLLNFVANTSCQYERNGEMHDGKEARNHIQKKFEYYKNKIKTAEDFIKYAATESKLSGKKYKVYCPDTPVQTSSDWLLKELIKFRGRL